MGTIIVRKRKLETSENYRPRGFRMLSSYNHGKDNGHGQSRPCERAGLIEGT